MASPKLIWVLDAVSVTDGGLATLDGKILVVKLTEADEEFEEPGQAGTGSLDPPKNQMTVSPLLKIY